MITALPGTGGLILVSFTVLPKLTATTVPEVDTVLTCTVNVSEPSVVVSATGVIVKDPVLELIVTVPDVETVDGDNVITKVDVGEGEIVSVNDSEVKGLDEGEAVVSIDGVFVGVKDGLLDVDGVLEGEIDAHTTPLPEETQGEPPTASRTT